MYEVMFLTKRLLYYFLIILPLLIHAHPKEDVMGAPVYKNQSPPSHPSSSIHEHSVLPVHVACASARDCFLVI